MKKLLLILLCSPVIGFGQTLIPDANFEQALINLGYDSGTPNGSVPTANIDTITSLNVGSQNISDLTGIEAFTALTDLVCDYNQLTSLNVSQNTALTYLYCIVNQLTTLDVSQNPALKNLICGGNYLQTLDLSNNNALTELRCDGNQLTSLDVSNNIALTMLAISDNQLTNLNVSSCIALTTLTCYDNQLTSLDVSNNINLEVLTCEDNQLTYLDISNNILLDNLFCSFNNLTELDLSQCPALEKLHCTSNHLICLNLQAGNNFASIDQIDATDNLQLSCVEVDSIGFFSSNPFNSFNFDSGVSFSNSCNNNCSATSTQEHTTNKELLKVTDLLGRETKQTNQPLFYIYDDGTVEKRIIIE